MAENEQFNPKEIAAWRKEVTAAKEDVKEIADLGYILQKNTKGANLKQIENAWNSMLLDLPKRRIDFLKKINKNYSIFLLSNTNAIHISKFKKNLGITRYNKFYNLFEKVYYSHKVGFRKPQTKIFKF